jgi:hypothetical protein
MVQAIPRQPGQRNGAKAWTDPLKYAKEVHIMHIFYRPKYQSDATLFLNELKAKDPELEAKQRQGRALLWNKAVDRNAWSEYRAAQVEQKPYVYQTDPK